MNEPWLLAPRELWGEKTVALPEDESHHALKVLRVAPPQPVTVTDGEGTVARCAADSVDGGRLVARVLERELHTRPVPAVIVYQGAPKGTKADVVTERLAELGAAEMVVFSSERSVVRWSGDKVERLARRWGAIARSAATQSRSPFVMATGAPLMWPELLEQVDREPAVITLWEDAERPLREVLDQAVDRIALVVGPEGGLTPAEAEALAAAGARLASLGPRILRTEVAPVAACSALLYHYGLLG